MSDTQPTRAHAPQVLKPPPSNPQKPPGQQRRLRNLGIALLLSLVIAFSAVLGGWAGYQSGKSTRQAQAGSQLEQYLKDQFELGLQDFEAGRYEVARQRFEYIVSQDPAYPGITEKLTQVMQILYATATPLPPAATITPTPTKDSRPVQELYNQAIALARESNWNALIETLIGLRKADPTFQVASVDGLLYIALRSRGLEKILNEGNLGGGSYDLALAERFGPLDIDASTAREWARLFMIGLSFWEVYPEQAVFYLSQVASAAPYLQDGSGWTALDRYREALIQYGDALSNQKAWCEAQTQYQLALSIRADAALEEKYKNAMLQCLGYTATPEMSATPTTTTTATLWTSTPVPIVDTPTATLPAPEPSATATPMPPTISPSSTPTPTSTLEIPQETPTDTAVPEQPVPTATPSDGGGSSPSALISWITALLLSGWHSFWLLGKII